MRVLDAAIRHVAFPNADVGTLHRQLHAVIRLTQRLLGLPEVGDVGVGPKPFDDVAPAVKNRDSARLEPTILAIATANAMSFAVGK